jgi:hypothetical protein
VTLLEYQRVTHFPTKVGNIRFRVEADGGVYVQRNRRAPPSGQEWAEEFPAAPTVQVRDVEKKIKKLLERHKFFAMEPLYQNPAGSDGVVETLTWRGPGGEKTVVADRARPPAFQKLVNDLMWGLDIADRP